MALKSNISASFSMIMTQYTMRRFIYTVTMGQVHLLIQFKRFLPLEHQAKAQ